MQFDNVFIAEGVVLLCVLAIVNACAPDSCGFEFFRQLLLNSHSSKNFLSVGNCTFKPSNLVLIPDIKPIKIYTVTGNG